MGENWKKGYKVQNLAQQQGPHMNRNGNTSRRCRSWKYCICTSRATLSNVPSAEESALLEYPRPNLEDGNASTNVQINDNDNKKRFKGRLVGSFQHCIRRLIVLLPPNEFLHSSPEAPRTIQAQETSAIEGRNCYRGIQLVNPEFTKVLGSFTCRKAGTWDRFFHFPSEGRHAEDYSDTGKI